MSINLHDTSNIEAVYEYLVHPFHSRPITGMDVCIKKNLIATCSSDKTVKIWSHSQTPTINDFKLEINKEFADEPYAIAFHPSGFHLIVSFPEKIHMMNIFQNDIV